MLLGFCGAIHGANSAKTTNTATSTMPIDASTLRRPSAAAVFHVVEAIVCQLTTKGRKATKEKISVPLTNPGLPSCSFVSFVVEILRRHCLPHDFLQRAGKCLILVRRSNAHAYCAGRAPR